MNKLLIIGSSGFIGGWLKRYLSLNLDPSKFKVYGTGHDHEDLTDFEIVRSIADMGFTHVINCVSKGSKNPAESTKEDLNYNIKMLEKFYLIWRDLDHYINIGSGSEFGHVRDIFAHREQNIWCDSGLEELNAYAKSKNKISRMLWGVPKATTLRLFGCFGPGEHPTRLFANYLDKCKYRQKSFDLQLREFSYFSIQDFCRVVQMVLENQVYGDFNCTYSREDDVQISETQSYPTTKDYLNAFKYLNKGFGHFPEVIYSNYYNDDKYVGDSFKLYTLMRDLGKENLLLGFEKSVRLYGV